MGYPHKIGSHRHNCLDRSRSSFSSINNTPRPIAFLPLLKAHPSTPSQLVPTYLPTHSLTPSLTHSPRLAQLFFCLAFPLLSFSFAFSSRGKKERKKERKQASEGPSISLSLSLSLLALLSLASSTSLQQLRICVLQRSGIATLVYSFSSSSSVNMFFAQSCAEYEPGF